jgi:hypothetical protein
MTLTPEQRAAAIEAMARAICKGIQKNPDKVLIYGTLQWHFYIVPATLALNAALPIIAAAMVSDKPEMKAETATSKDPTFVFVGDSILQGKPVQLVSDKPADAQPKEPSAFVKDVRSAAAAHDRRVSSGPQGKLDRTQNWRPGGQHAEAGE